MGSLMDAQLQKKIKAPESDKILLHILLLRNMKMLKTDRLILKLPRTLYLPLMRTVKVYNSVWSHYFPIICHIHLQELLPGFEGVRSSK